MEGFLLKRADRGLVRPYKNRWFVLAGRELRIFVKHTSTDPMAVYDLSEISDPLFVCYMAPPKKTVGGRRASVASSSIPDGFDQCSGRRVSLVGSSAAPIPLPTSAPPPPVRRSEPNTAPQGYYFEIRHPKKTIELLAPTMELRNAWTAVFRAAISGHPISKTEFEKHLSNQDAVLNAEHSRSQLSISASSSRRHSISSPSDSPHHHQMIRKYVFSNAATQVFPSLIILIYFFDFLV
ncbi:MAG: hypothetical protein Q8P67_15325 [archaeon]|nr:hypothetical protein [archaeon]